MTGVERVYLFRTYKNLRKSSGEREQALERNPDLAHDIPIWQVARATTAAPTYFKPIVIDGREYLDGGFGANNPCQEIYEEVRKMNNNSDKCAALILSVGTGKNTETRRFKGTGLSRFLNYLNFARKWASDSEQADNNMLRTNQPEKFQYFRWNVERGLEKMKLDEWKARGSIKIGLGRCIGRLRSAGTHDTVKTVEMQNLASATRVHNEGDTQSQNGDVNSNRNREPTQNVVSSGNDPLLGVPQWLRPKNRTLETIRKHTDEYLSGVQQEIDKCAEELVRIRRTRAKKDPQRWERACFGAWYQCNVTGCPRGEYEYPGRHALEKHLTHKHNDLFHDDDLSGLEARLNSCKIVIH